MTNTNAIETAIALLEHMKSTALEIETELRSRDSLADFREAWIFAKTDILADDYPLDVLDATDHLISLCDTI